MENYHNHTNNLEDLLTKLPTYKQAEEITNILSVLSDPSRLRILWFLCHTTECVNDISKAVNMSSPAVSHHLKLLKQVHIIESKKEGKEMLYTLADNKYARLIHKMIDNMFEITIPELKHKD